MSYLDYKNRVVKIGDRVKIIKDIPTSDGMLYRNTIVKVNEIVDEKIRVTDTLGKIWHVTSSDISVGFL